jgi:lipoyl(octanoyl) transferase
MDIQDLGTIGYQAAWDLQRQLVEERKAQRIPDTLLLLEHPHVYTLGRNARPEHLLSRPPEVEVYQTDRGGDITYHGPGQLVGYPIFDLNGIRKDVVWYVRSLEEALIRALAEFGITAGRKPRYTGVWVAGEKMAAIGVHISRWVTSHGFALNVAPELRYFQFIVPCGIREHGVTSMERRLGRRPDMAAVKQSVARQFEGIFTKAAAGVAWKASGFGLQASGAWRSKPQARSPD